MRKNLYGKAVPTLPPYRQNILDRGDIRRSKIEFHSSLNFNPNESIHGKRLFNSLIHREKPYFSFGIRISSLSCCEKKFSSNCTKTSTFHSKLNNFHQYTKIINNPLHQLMMPKRCLHLHEFRNKELLNESGILVQEGYVASTAEDAKAIAQKLIKESFLKNPTKPLKFVVKCQILAGGRGKGTLSSGLSGGVQICNTPNEVEEITQKMLNYKLKTHQTIGDGVLVDKVYICKYENIVKEFYFAIILNREKGCPTFIFSPIGGVDIEFVAKSNPDQVHYLHLTNFMKYQFTDITDGSAKIDSHYPILPLDHHTKNEILNKLGIFQDSGEFYSLYDIFSEQIDKFYEFFFKYNCVQIEINPLCIVESNKNKKNYELLSVDAKLQFDDNSLYKNPFLLSLQDKNAVDPREAAAEDSDLNFVGLDGSVGCLVNGAGLAMATMDIIKLYGASPANFLDVGGNAEVHQAKEAFKILQSDSNVKCLFVNIFGGIMRCDIIAQGLVEAARTINLKLPLVVRLCGNRVDEGRRILEESGITCHFIEDFEEAAKKACLLGVDKI